MASKLPRFNTSELMKELSSIWKEAVKLPDFKSEYSPWGLHFVRFHKKLMRIDELLPTILNHNTANIRPVWAEIKTFFISLKPIMYATIQLALEKQAEFIESHLIKWEAQPNHYKVIPIELINYIAEFYEILLVIMQYAGLYIPFVKTEKPDEKLKRYLLE